jgi:hypothetical protein
MNYLNTNSSEITGYFPTYDGDTSGPYYARLNLVRADDKRMIGLEKAQARQELYGFLAFVSVLTTALTYLFCSLL